MTAQLSHTVINESPDIDLSSLLLYGVVAAGDDGRPTGQYFEEPPCNLEKNVYIESCRVGFRATYRITVDREVELVQYQLPEVDGPLPDEVEANPTIWGSFKAAFGFPEKLRMVPSKQPIGEKLSGNFWLLLKEQFFAPECIYIPAVDGILQADTSRWVYR